MFQARIGIAMAVFGSLIAAPTLAFAAEWIIVVAPAASVARADANRSALETRCSKVPFWIGSANVIGGKADRFVVYAGPYPTKPEANWELPAIKRCAPKSKVVSADFSEPG